MQCLTCFGLSWGPVLQVRSAPQTKEKDKDKEKDKEKEKAKEKAKEKEKSKPKDQAGPGGESPAAEVISPWDSRIGSFKFLAISWATQDRAVRPVNWICRRQFPHEQISNPGGLGQ